MEIIIHRTPATKIGIQLISQENHMMKQLSPVTVLSNFD